MPDWIKQVWHGPQEFALLSSQLLVCRPHFEKPGSARGHIAKLLSRGLLSPEQEFALAFVI